MRAMDGPNPGGNLYVNRGTTGAIVNVSPSADGVAAVSARREAAVTTTSTHFDVGLH